MNLLLRFSFLVLFVGSALGVPQGNEEMAPVPEETRSAFENGRMRLDAGDVAGARKYFEAAVQADGSRSENYFYLAVATYRMGEVAAAREYAAKALASAAEAEKERTLELVNAIEGRFQFDQLVVEADQAVARGLLAKAADTYARAFRAAPAQGEVGLRAASLYATRLNRPLEAAALWNKVMASGDRASADAAAAELGQRRVALDTLFASTLAETKSAGDVRKLTLLAEAFPQRAEPHLELAVAEARQRAVRKVVQYLGEAIKLGTDLAIVKSRPEFFQLLQQDGTGEFRTFVNDAFGDSGVAEIEGAHRERSAAKQAALDRENAQRSAEEMARAKQTIWTDVAAELQKLIGRGGSFTWTQRWTSQLNIYHNYSYSNGVSFKDGRLVINTLHDYQTSNSKGTSSDWPTSLNIFYKVPSFASLQSVTTVVSGWAYHDWGAPPSFTPAGVVGPEAQRFRVIVLQFSDQIVEWQGNGKHRPLNLQMNMQSGRVNRVVIPVIFGDLAHAAQVEKLFRRLQKADTASLLELRAMALGSR
ncbi:MAG: hypothetical protein C0518_08290 [Opitutus sp.]|nr:hypothetical protein [Opitutus sp.]